MKIFTKRFFTLSRHDQAAIVDSVIRDLESARFLDADGERRAAQMVKRITKKAIKHGVYAGQEEGAK
jgi:hypothetical protein